MDDRRQRLRNQIVNLLDDDGLLIFPVFPRPGPFQASKHRLRSTFSASQPSPAPMGMNSTGLPAGVQLVAAPYREGLLIAAAKVLESAFGGWQQPPQKM